MQTYISQQNLTTLLDTLIKQGTRVVAPHMNAGIPLYEPLTSAEDMVTDQLPRRSAKETFFPVCEDIMSYDQGRAEDRTDGHRSGPVPGDGPGGRAPLRRRRHPGAGCGLLLGL